MVTGAIMIVIICVFNV